MSWGKAEKDQLTPGSQLRKKSSSEFEWKKGERTKKVRSYHLPLGSHWCKSKWTLMWVDDSIFDQYYINFTISVICVALMAFLWIYNRVNEDRPKPSEKIPFVRRILWISMSRWDLNMKTQNSLNFLGKFKMAWKWTMSVWTIYLIFMEELNYLKWQSFGMRLLQCTCTKNAHWDNRTEVTWNLSAEGFHSHCFFIPLYIYIEKKITLKYSFLSIKY